MRSLKAAVAAALLLPATANAATVVNGDFETGPNPGSFTTVNAGGTIGAWTVLSGSVDYIGSYWQPQGGSRSVDLNGNSQGAIEQAIATVIGQAYEVTFWLAGNPDSGPQVKTVKVAAANANGMFTFDTFGVSRAAMGWQKYTFNFTANSASTLLSFASQDAGAYGAALDTVSISAVPEPATWAMMLFGFVLVGGAMRRRTAARPANHLSFA
ncbi:MULTISPECIES: choice-of-anchor C family protein [unclassified Sphingopyxis]|jgi:choice-of-anchor C domain-containing protein|uniref:choice-of-anchor C family PEP-CTERM protein n=1 Tax=unclassified Sphingopyxis TaxID=2614943 RepID=UPI0024AE6913|nr:MULTISPECIES: choice-of-anchor C family protein [unclassified Sphingopyxis]